MTGTLGIDVLIFVAATLAIGYAGTKLAGLADRLADRTGLGEAVTGTVLLGLTTALPGLTASVTAAVEGYAALSISNAMGGIAVQTAALAVGDIFYRKANLEHAAASAPNMLQTSILVFLLSIVLVTLTGPDVTVAHIHPSTFLLIAAAAVAFYLVYRTSERPMWRPRQTPETVEDVPEPFAHLESLPKLIFGFLLAAAVVTAAGVAVAESAGTVTEQTGISQTLMGGLFTAIATSLPELVTTVAAVRRGALTLAVSDIVGGNFFDVLFVAMADLAYLQGSIYHAGDVSMGDLFLTGLTILLNVMLLIGLLYRQKSGPANIGFESVLMLVIYVAGFLILRLAM